MGYAQRKIDFLAYAQRHLAVTLLPRNRASKARRVTAFCRAFWKNVNTVGF
jgi:hypothetical protein